MEVMFDRHIAKPKRVTIENVDGDKDVFVLQPLPYKFLADLFSMFTKFSGLDEKMSNEDLMKRFDKETVSGMTELIMATLKRSYPDVPEDKLGSFCSAHFMDLFQAVVEVNMPNVASKGAQAQRQSNAK